MSIQSTQRTIDHGFGRADRGTPSAMIHVNGTNVRKLLRKLAGERALRRTERELRSLDDRTLKDIGLFRGEISSFLRDGRHSRLTLLFRY